MNTIEQAQVTEMKIEKIFQSELKSAGPVIVKRLLNVIPIDIEKLLKEIAAE